MAEEEKIPRQDSWPNLVRPEYTNAQQTPEQRKESASKAGKASGAARRLRRTQADILRQILALPEQDEAKRELLRTMGLDGNMADSINWAVSTKAALGDVEAVRYVRDTIGERPREGLEISGLDGRPVETLDMSKLTDEQLRALAETRKTGSDMHCKSAQSPED